MYDCKKKTMGVCLCCVLQYCGDHVFEFVMANPTVEESARDLVCVVCVCVCVSVRLYVDACEKKTMGACVCV